VRLAAIKTFVVLAVASGLRHRFHGPPIDYLGLAAAAAASWVGLPGPGETVLIAASVLAARHKLAIGPVIAVAFVAATAGGVAGWLAGMKAGRVVLSARGPLWRQRRSALERGDEIFGRAPVLAIFLTPSWVAGIHRVRFGIYILVNTASAALWAVGIGLAAYFIGPSVVDFVGDLGTVTEIGLVLLVIAAVVLEIRRRRRRRTRREGPAAARSTEDPAPARSTEGPAPARSTEDR
jgi:membrane protein DedA with SNARE-associated domain